MMKSKRKRGSESDVDVASGIKQDKGGGKSCCRYMENWMLTWEFGLYSQSLKLNADVKEDLKGHNRVQNVRTGKVHKNPIHCFIDKETEDREVT